MKHIELLRSLDMFAQVAEDDLHAIAALLKERRVAKDTIIVQQGDIGDALYLVASGRVRGVAHDSAGREKVLGFFSEGEAFGEMSLFAGEPRPATYQTMADSRLLVLRKDEFDSYLAHNVQVMLQIMKVMAHTPPAPPAASPAEAAPTPAPAPTPAVAPEAPTPVPVPELYSPKGKLFTIFSPRGGVGKSTLAVNLAVALAHIFPDQVALVDLSLNFGHDALLLNLIPVSSLAATSAQALAQMNVEDLGYYQSIHSFSTLRVVAGALRPEEGEVVSGDTVRVALQRFCRQYAYVIVDAGSNFGDPVLAALEGSDRIIMLCSPEISTLRDVRECQRVFEQVVQIPRSKVAYVMNHLFPFKTLSREQCEATLEQPLFAELPYGGETPARAALRGEAFVEKDRSSSIARSIEKLAVQLSADGSRTTNIAQQQDKKKGFFR